MSSYIYLYTGYNKTCEEKDGVLGGFYKIKSDKGDILCRRVERYKKFINNDKERDFSNGGHDCIISFNYYKIYKKLVVVDNPPNGIKMKCCFLDDLQSEVNYIRKVRKEGCRHVVRSS